MKIGKLVILSVVISLHLPFELLADYTMVLEDDRRITVTKYRQDGDMIIFPGLGGEIGVLRKEIRSIAPATETEFQGVVVARMYSSLGSPERPQEPSASSQDLGEKESRQKVLELVRELQEARKYQGMYRELAGEIQITREIHWLITRGTTTTDPVLLTSLRTIKARMADLISRIKDAERNPAQSRGTGIVNLETGSPFAGRRMTIGLRHGGKTIQGRVSAYPINLSQPGMVGFPDRVSPRPGDFQITDYTHQERKLSRLRSQLLELYQQRKQLIEDMKARGIFTGSMLLEEIP